MLEEYFLVQGREWERFAWLKSRVVAPRTPPATRAPAACATWSAPFVYRRYLDYGVFEGLRQLHARSASEAKARRRPARAGQRRQALARRHPRDRVHRAAAAGGARRPVPRDPHPLHVKALQHLAAARADDEATRPPSWLQAVVFLRQVEHRIQYLDDQQTHLPARGGRRRPGWIAASPGLVCDRNSCQLLERLDEVREFVAAEFDALLHGPRRPLPRRLHRLRLNAAGAGRRGLPGQACPRPWPRVCAAWLRTARGGAPGRKPPAPGRLIAAAACTWRLANAAKTPHCALWTGWSPCCAARATCPAGGAARRSSSACSPAGRGALAHALPDAPPRRDRRAGRRPPAAWPLRARRVSGRTGRAPRRLDAQRRGRRRRGPARHPAPRPPCRGLPHPGARRRRRADRRAGGRRPLLLADATLQCTLDWVWRASRTATARRRASPSSPTASSAARSWATAATSTWSLFDDEDERASEVYGALCAALVTWLTLRTSAGELFDIDTALRPNGNSGLLVTSMDSSRRLPNGPGQQHRLDLGAPGHHPRALLRRLP